MAYWLGFVFAYGTVYMFHGNYRVALGLTCCDYDNVVEFQDAVESTYHVIVVLRGRDKDCCALTQLYNHKMGVIWLI